MRGKTAKRIRKNIYRNQDPKVLLEINNYYGERTKDFTGPRSVYKAAKDAYKWFRRIGEHSKANLFVQETK